jgi:ubiquinone/menaquinone biosynthesis C-methylase UbiE
VSSIDRRRTSFDEVADLYDEVRPSYPASVIDHIIQFAGVQDDSEILEIGCGTGQMTMPFAEKGCRILALEPAPTLSSSLEREHSRMCRNTVRSGEERTRHPST